ncbi:MAG: outer membrane protein assembly factor BamD [Alphaproteobacteria bacterium]|nr:outer membrane protein assembly factor BamD [Alphaproteobacteria bacterium]
MTTLSIRRYAIALALSLLASGCGGTKETAADKPVEELYNAAMDKFSDADFRGAATAFDEVDRQHPYSVWATKAQIMDAYALYQAQKYDEAVVALDRFIQLHPGNRDAAYAYYLKALCYYVQIVDVGRDQKVTGQALKALDEVIRRFPESRYARDARLKLDLTRDHLAGKEMEIGRYYENQGQYLAAINRFRRVVDNYQTTTHVPEALHRLTECYLTLGIVDEARSAAAVLGHNYPGSEWYQDSYALLTGAPSEAAADEKPSKGWMARIIGSLF